MLSEKGGTSLPFPVSQQSQLSPVRSSLRPAPSIALVMLCSALISLALAAASGAVAHPFGGPHSSTQFVLFQHLGNLSPYFKAPLPKGLQEGLPDGCVVDQASLVSCKA